MTHEQLAKDVERFNEYLKANGVRPLAYQIMVELSDKTTVGIDYGFPEMFDEMTLRSKAHRLGFKVVDR